MFKLNKKIKKILAIIMLAMMIITNLPISAFATYITDMNSDAQFGVVSGSLSDYGHELHYAKYSGDTYLLFCAQYGETSPSGKTYEYDTDFKIELNSGSYQKVAEYIYFGYTMKYGAGLPSSSAAKKAACATQQFVWEYIRDHINSSFGAPGRNSWDSSYMSSSIYSSWLSETEQTYNSYHNDNVSFNGETKKVNIGESITVNDTNGVLESYQTFNETINGVNFKHTQGSNDIVITSDKNSNADSVTFKSMDYGMYRLMPSGARYSKNEMSSYMYFKFSSGAVQNLIFSSYVDPSYFGFKVKIEAGKINLKKTDDNGTALAGCVFKLYKDQACTQEVSTGTSQSNGNITFDKLVPGTYYIKETQVPKGYLIDNTVQKVNVKAGETSEVSFKNNEPLGEIKIYKVSENKDKIDGAEFVITAAEKITNVSGSKTYYTKGQTVATITTENGTASKSNLPMGKYLVKETKAPYGYLLNEKTFEANLVYKDTKTPSIELEIKGIVNEEPRGSISLVKKDKETGSVPQGDAKLENAVYKLYANEDIYNVAKSKKYYSKGDLVATRTTDAKGNCEDIKDLPLGKYVLKEDSASKGYLVDKTEYNIELKYKDQNERIITNATISYETVKKMQVHVYKSGIKVQSGLVRGLEGAEFTIKLYSDVEKAKKAGYSYEEIWNGIDENGNKVNVDSNRVAEAQVIAPSYQSITTDSEGNAYSKELPYGKYWVKETVTPKDFYTALDFTFSIEKDSTEITEIAQKVKHLFVNDEQMEPYIKLVKKDKTSGKIVTLTSATFQIKATKDIYDRGNGKIVYKKGEIIKQKIGSTTYDSFTTNSQNLVVPEGSYNNNKDENGTIVTPLTLPVGSYEITEIKIPDGFLKLESPVTFNIEGIRDYDKDADGDYIKTVTIKNEQPTATIIIDKSVALRENADTSLVDVSDLSGIQFKLIAKTDITDKADGSVVYKANQVVGTYNLDKKGNLKIEKLLMGEYQIEEIKTLPGLVLNNTKYDFKFEKKDDITKVYTQTREVVNDTTLTDFSKKSITGQDELEGAKLTVIDNKGKVVDSWVSGKDTHKIEGLEVEKEYTLREEIAPEGYTKSTDIKFKVDNTNKIQKVEMVDKIVEMSKQDVAGKELEGAKMQVFDKDNKIVDEWTSSKEAHKIKGLEEGQTYRLHEEVAIEGYVKATDAEFTVTLDKETQKVVMIDKIVEMSKQNIGGEELEGAKMKVFDKDNKIVDEWTSSKEAHKIKGLEESQTYRLHEEVAIEGYVKATDAEFTVTTDKETQKVVMIDKIVTITKTDLTNGEELEGAELIVTDEEGNEIDKWISTKEPHHVTGLEEGKKYTLTEITCPYGYEQAESIEFVVTTDKETQIIEMKDMPILKTIKVIKADSSTKENIKGEFTFGLYEDKECTRLIQQMDSDKENGTVTFEELRYGTYYIKETRAPRGYQLSDKVVEIKINDEGVFADDELLEEKDEAYSFIFYDDLIPAIHTGSIISNVVLIITAILSAIGTIAGVIIFKKKNKDIY